MGENVVQIGRAMAAPLAPCRPWRRRLMRPRSAIVMSVHYHGCFSQDDNSVVRRVGRGLPSSCRRWLLSHWWLGRLSAVVRMPTMDRGGWHWYNRQGDVGCVQGQHL
jgi:hypothetical protein